MAGLAHCPHVSTDEYESGTHPPRNTRSLGPQGAPPETLHRARFRWATRRPLGHSGRCRERWDRHGKSAVPSHPEKARNLAQPSSGRHHPRRTVRAFDAARPLGSDAVARSSRAFRPAEVPPTAAAFAMSLQKTIAELEQAGASHGEVIFLLKRLIAEIKADVRHTAETR